MVATAQLHAVRRIERSVAKREQEIGDKALKTRYIPRSGMPGHPISPHAVSLCLYDSSVADQSIVYFRDGKLKVKKVAVKLIKKLFMMTSNRFVVEFGFFRFGSRVQPTTFRIRPLTVGFEAIMNMGLIMSKVENSGSMS